MLLMIRPCSFGYNPQTAVNNAFQTEQAQEHVQERALAEFDAYVALLRAHNIEVLVVEDTPLPHTPDSIFPNNWISFHPNGLGILYPMYAPNRRLERKKTVFSALQENAPRIRWIDLSPRERIGQYLEGTGSMIFDRLCHRAYACRSPRTDETLFREVCDTLAYKPLLFDAVGSPDPETGTRTPIYHTNVMMCMANQYVVICLDSIPEAAQKENLLAQFKEDQKEVVPITLDQMNHFAGNMLQVFDKKGKPYLVLSKQAYNSLTPEQCATLTRFNPLITPALPTIETNGGGSARCMLAEIV